MKYHPIIFNTAMVQAIELGHKTQTRRTKGLEEINKNPNCFIYDGINEEDDSYCGDHYFELVDLKGTPKERYYPVENNHQVGDVFWVRETFRAIEQDVGSPIYEYKATETINLTDKWKPAIHMPKEACRLFLEIKSIRAERLQDISDNDALAEGVYLNYWGVFRDYLKENHAVSGFDFPKESFKSLWISIYKEESWNANPFVWVYEFEKIEKPKGFI
jgi:hypothetical protein